MIRRYKVRFNLSRGKNYMKWKVEGPNGVFYYEPSEHILVMYDCQLKNSKATAKKIHDGAHKTVCAWVRSSHVQVARSGNKYKGRNIYYNPRAAPYWTDEHGNDIDDSTCAMIISDGKQLFIYKHYDERV